MEAVSPLPIHYYATTRDSIMSTEVQEAHPIITACDTLINHFKVVTGHFRSSEEGSVFNNVSPLMDVVMEVREAPKKVTGTYDEPASFIRDTLTHHQQRHGIAREEIRPGILYSVGEAAHLLAYLLRRQLLVYSGLGADKTPEFYVGLTPDTTHCVAIYCRERTAFE